MRQEKVGLEGGEVVAAANTGASAGTGIPEAGAALAPAAVESVNPAAGVAANATANAPALAAPVVEKTEEEKFAELFDTPQDFFKLKKLLQLMSLILTVAATVLFIPIGPATSAVALGLSIWNFILMSTVTLKLDGHIFGWNQDRKILQACRAKINECGVGSDLYESELDKFKKMKLHSYLKSRMSLNLLALIFTVTFAILKFVGILASSTVLSSPYFLMGFMIVPLIAKGLSDIFLQSNVQFKKKELLDFYPELCAAVRRQHDQILVQEQRVLSIRQLDTILPNETIMLLARRALTLMPEAEYGAVVAHAIAKQPGANPDALMNEITRLRQQEMPHEAEGVFPAIMSVVPPTRTASGMGLVTTGAHEEHVLTLPEFTVPVLSLPSISSAVAHQPAQVMVRSEKDEAADGVDGEGEAEEDSEGEGTVPVASNSAHGT